MLRPDELAGTGTAGERPRRLCTAQVDRNRDPDHDDAEQLEGVAEPPAELHVVEDERPHESGGEERKAHDHEQVREAPGQKVGVDRPDLEEGEENEPDGEECERQGAARLGNGRDELRPEHPDQADQYDGEEQDRLEDEQGPNASRPVDRRQGREREDRGADDERGAAREGH
jgi:hypothetical protein